MHSGQLRAARALVGWSQARLAYAANLTTPEIKDMEAAGAAGETSARSRAVRRALETAGVVFIPPVGGGPGVRLRR